MPDFTTEIDIDPYEYVDECSRHEKQELIDELVSRGFVLQISSPIETKPNLLRQNQTFLKLSGLIPYPN